MNDDLLIEGIAEPVEVGEEVSARRRRAGDWRLWASIAVSLLLVVALIGFLVTLDSRSDKEQQVEDLRTEVAELRGLVDGLEEQGATGEVTTECRARMAFETDREASEMAVLTARALADVGRGESPADAADGLDREADEYEIAIDERDAVLDALERGEIPAVCNEEDQS